ncbi:hypothetical protein [Haloarcula litorea]|uniref:hypothetical protein n=1 Tax=Haloarcula litorea TaxID=3032579 RepID=UPI0023E83A9E|nr:hypothetical protein [Halomicroarcula sp. GDY20]
MTAADRRTVQVTPQPEINSVPKAVQNHREQQQEDEEDEDLGIVKRAKNSDFTAISMQDQASGTDSSVEAESLKKYLDGEHQQ